MNVVVFVDQQNIYRSARDAYCWRTADSLKGNPLPLQLARMLAIGDLAVPLPGEGHVSARTLKKVLVYMGLPQQTRERAEYERASRQKKHWEYGNREVEVRHRALKYPPGWTAESPERPPEKGIDVMLAMDVVRGTIEPAAECFFDVAILVSADSDLIPVVEFVIDKRGHDRIQTVAPENVRDRAGRMLGNGPAPIRGSMTQSRTQTNRTIVIPRRLFERVADRVNHYERDPSANRPRTAGVCRPIAIGESLVADPPSEAGLLLRRVVH